MLATEKDPRFLEKYKHGELYIYCHGGKGKFVPSTPKPVIRSGLDVTVCETCGFGRWSHYPEPFSVGESAPATKKPDTNAAVDDKVADDKVSVADSVPDSVTDARDDSVDATKTECRPAVAVSADTEWPTFEPSGEKEETPKRRRGSSARPRKRQKCADADPAPTPQVSPPPEQKPAAVSCQLPDTPPPPPSSPTLCTTTASESSERRTAEPMWAPSNSSSDEQASIVRERIMEVLRTRDGEVHRDAIATAVPDATADDIDEALARLCSDGICTQQADDVFALWNKTASV